MAHGTSLLAAESLCSYNGAAQLSASQLVMKIMAPAGLQPASQRRGGVACPSAAALSLQLVASKASYGSI